MIKYIAVVPILHTCVDKNECKDPSQHSCADGFQCVNTVGSYTCHCNGLVDDGKCIQDVKRHRVQLRLNELYKTELNVTTSEEFKSMSSRISNAMHTVYAGNKDFLNVEIVALRNGSVIAELDLFFNNSHTSGVSDLLAAIRENSFGDFDVDPDALTVIMTGTCPSDFCPGNSTCNELTQSTISCPCNDGYHSNGVSCVENVVVKVVITLEAEFVEELNNKSSPVYIELKQNVTEELRETFKDTPNFQDVVVLGFRNGSIITDFVVILRDDPGSNEKADVAKTIQKELIENGGNFENLKLKGGPVIKEKPTAPTNLTHTDVTETKIDIRWSPPRAKVLFGIQGYTIGFRTFSASQYEIRNKTLSGSEEDNIDFDFQLPGLNSDTVYFIKVHAFNEEGEGEKVEIQVATEKPEESNTTLIIIIVVVVIVVVLIIIIILVVKLRIRDRNRKRRDQQISVRPGYIEREDPHRMEALSSSSRQTKGEVNKSYKDEEASGSQKL